MTTVALRMPPLRRLPRTLPPMLNETVSSYLGRLAQVNALTGSDLELHLAGGGKPKTGDVTAEKLAAITGYPPRTLRYAMLELCTTDDLAVMHVGGRPCPGPTDWGWWWPHNRIRYACDHCAAQHAVTSRGSARPQLWTTHEDVVCLRHRRWLSALHQDAQLDLAHLPDILKANRQHRRMIKTYGREQVRSATIDAAPICRGWNEPLWDNSPAYRRVQTFKDQGHETRFIDNATITAATYPETVALTRLFASPYWRHLAMTENLEPVDKTAVIRLFDEIHAQQPDTQLVKNLHAAAAGVLQEGPALERFVREIQRTVYPDYHWDAWSHYRKFPAITQWIMDQIDAARNPDDYRLQRRHQPPEHYGATYDVPRSRDETSTLPNLRPPRPPDAEVSPAHAQQSIPEDLCEPR